MLERASWPSVSATFNVAQVSMSLNAPSGATYPLDLVRARLSIASAKLASRNTVTPAFATTSVISSAFTAEDAKLGIIGMSRKVYATEGGIRGL